MKIIGFILVGFFIYGYFKELIQRMRLEEDNDRLDKSLTEVKNNLRSFEISQYRTKIENTEEFKKQYKLAIKLIDEVNLVYSNTIFKSKFIKDSIGYISGKELADDALSIAIKEGFKEEGDFYSPRMIKSIHIVGYTP